MNPQTVRLDSGADPAGAGTFGTDDRIRELVRSLVQSLACCELAPTDIAQELIVDIEVDGARYLLIRQACQKPGIQAVLSPREMEVARMVSKGYPNKVIAGVLEISSWTVCTHLRRIFAKLGVTSRAAMVARIVEEGGVITSPRLANR